MRGRYKYITVSNYLEIGERMEIPDPIRDDVAEAGGLEGISSKVPDDLVLRLRSRTFRALADPIRLRIMIILSIQPLCVCCMKEMMGISDSKLSYHLSQLKEAGLIKGKQEKNWIIYRPTEAGKKIIEVL
jgi:ArsR family transcriptional regulator